MYQHRPPNRAKEASGVFFTAGKYIYMRWRARKTSRLCDVNPSPVPPVPPNAGTGLGQAWSCRSWLPLTGETPGQPSSAHTGFAVPVFARVKRVFTLGLNCVVTTAAGDKLYRPCKGGAELGLDWSFLAKCKKITILVRGGSTERASLFSKEASLIRPPVPTFSVFWGCH